jgi:hypothetical protein
MTKKQFLELLIKSYGLTPLEIEHFRTDGCDGQYKIGIGWKGAGINLVGEDLINFHEPDGFNMAVYEILKQANKEKLKPMFVE